MSQNGRPRVLDETKKREVCALVSAGGSMNFAGRYVGCTAKTIRNEARRDPEFGDRLRKSEMTAQLEPLRALRQKATTHWRAAAWLLERADPEQYVRLDQKMYKPQEVADMLENVRTALQYHIGDLVVRAIACRVVDRVIREAGLPPGRARAKLGQLPTGFAPDLLDPLQLSFPAPGDKSTQERPEAQSSQERMGQLFSHLHDTLAEKTSNTADP